MQINTFVDADAYERWVGRWSRRVAQRFLSALNSEDGARWLDAGCGSGVVTEAILKYCSPARVVGLDPSAALLAHGRQVLSHHPIAQFVAADAQHLPFRANAFDAIISGLVLNYIPDLATAASEMRRVVRSGAIVGAYVWDYADGMEMIRLFWDAAIELDETVRDRDQRTQATIARPDALEELFAHAGFTDVSVWAIEMETPFENFDDYWSPFLGGQGPAPAYVASLTDAARERLREQVRSRMPIEPDGRINLTARAWAVRAIG